MNYVFGFLNLFFGIGAIVVGVFGLQQYFGGAEKDLARLENLKNEGQIAIAELDTMVLELKVKGIKTYSLAYTFDVKGKTFKDSYHFRDYKVLDTLTGKVTYLPSDPANNSLNINGELAKAKEDVADYESSSLGLWLGIILVLFGLYQLFRAYRRLVAARASGNPPPVPEYIKKHPNS